MQLSTQQARGAAHTATQVTPVKPTKRVQALIVAVAFILAFSSEVYASGFGLPILGPSAFGPTTPGPSSTHLNPGGLGFAEKLHIVIGGDLVMGYVKYRRLHMAQYQREDSLDYNLPIDATDIDPRKTGWDKSVGGLLPRIGDTVIPALAPSIFIEAPLPRMFKHIPMAAGFSIAAPYVAPLTLPRDGPQRFQLTHATLGTVFATGSLAMKIADWLSIGGGISYVFGLADLGLQMDLATLDDLGAALARPPINQPNSLGSNADPAMRELTVFDRKLNIEKAIAHGITFRLGFLAHPNKHWWIGGSYEHSTNLNFRGTFRLNMKDSFFTDDLVSQGLDFPSVVRGKASLSFTLPRVFRGGIRYAFGKEYKTGLASSIALEGSITTWSQLQYFDVRVSSDGLEQPQIGIGRTLRVKLQRDWHDSYMVLGRIAHSFSEGFGGFGALGVESSAVPDSTLDMAGPDNNRITIAGGINFQLTDAIRAHLEVIWHQFLGTRKNRASDYDRGNGDYMEYLAFAGGYLDIDLPDP